jgi:tape measure domain-containing protein
MAISTTFTLKFAGSAVERGLARVQSAFKSLGGVAMKVGKSLLSPFAALTALLGTGALVGGLVSFVKGSSEAAASIEDLTMQIETLTKSVSITKGLIAEFRKEAAKSPLSIEDYAEAGKLLLNFGTNVDDVMPRLKTLADVSMGNSDRFAGLALAFAQTTAKGRLMGQELNQMTERGFNPLQIISKKTGISVGDLMKRMEEGKISIKAVAEAFRIATSKGGDFYQAIEKGANTTSGKIAKTKDSILGLKIAFGEGFNIGLKNALDRVNEFLPKMLGKFKEFGLQTGKIMIQLMDAFEQGRLGTVFITALDAGVAKFGEELLALMTHAGNTFFDALENRATKSAVWKTLTWGGLDVDTPKTKTGKDKSEMTYAELRQEYANMFGSQNNAEILRQTLQKQGAVPTAPGYRYAKPGEAATIMDGERVVRILESIDLKLAPQP